MDADRFSNMLGEAYDLFGKVIPHHNEFQDKVGLIIREYAAQRSEGNLVAIEGGCGTGISTLRILEADNRINVVAIDNEEKTIRRARLVLEHFIERVSLNQEDVLTYLRTLPSESADIFVSV